LIIAANARPLHILVIGAYGFIGQAVTRQLLTRGHRVTGLGRSARTGKRLLPSVHWVERDLAHMNRAELWLPLLDGVDVVINAAGALQDSARDDLRAVQDQAVQALIGASEQTTLHRYIQISAVGADTAAATRFLRTKGRADQRLLESSLDWVILRPGLVIGANAYGGGALLRALAALPGVQPLVLGSARIQCVGLTQVAAIVARAAESGFPPKTIMDLVEPNSHALHEVIGAMRTCLGLGPARWHLEIPLWCGNLVAAGADLLGSLGWRSPLRSTSLRHLEAGVTGNPETAHALLGQPLMDLEQILAGMPATVGDRWFAQLYLLMPVMVATLSAFWVLSGLIALANLPAATNVFAGSVAFASTLVIVASLADIGLGLAVLYRPWTRWACWGMVVMTLVYLASATVYLPHLWWDPLGPLLKSIPAMLLALLTPVFLVER
jgi:uncharacterized protein YbjT (DUF2867 family)